MTTGEKIAALRKKKGLTQEQLSEMLKLSRQSVSRWEMDVAFPETEKLIKLSKILECSIDFLLNDAMQDEEMQALSIKNVQMDEEIDITEGIDLTCFDPVIYSGHYHSVGKHLGKIGDYLN